MYSEARVRTGQMGDILSSAINNPRIIAKSIETVAIYSDADSNALHTRYAQGKLHPVSNSPFPWS